jgi:H+/Cl- antiporter ClcA
MGKNDDIKKRTEEATANITKLIVGGTVGTTLQALTIVYETIKNFPLIGLLLVALIIAAGFAGHKMSADMC